MELKPRYKQTEVGVIPADWRVETLGNVGRWFSGGTPSMANESYWSGDIPWVSAKDMKVSRVYDSQLHVTEKAIGNGTRLAASAAVLMVVRGMILAHTLPVALAMRPVAFNQDMKALETFDDVHSEFVLLWLQSNSQRILGITSESTHGTKRIPSDDLFVVKLALPRLPEQRAIAEALGDVDALLASLDRLIAKKRDIKQAVMQQLLTGKTRLPGFSGEWKVKRLGDVVDIDPENLDSATQPNFRFYYIALEDVDHGQLRSFSELRFADAPSRARRKLRSGDVLVSTVRPNLQSHLLFKETAGMWVCSTGFCVVRCRAGSTIPAYVFFQLFGGSVTRQIDALLTGSSYPAINSRDVRSLEMPIPSVSEQASIAEVLSEMEMELEMLAQRRDKTQLLKQGMMQELLTGRTRLV